MSCYDHAARINFNEGNFKRQIVKGRVSFRILTLTLGIALHGHLLNWGVTPSDSVDKNGPIRDFSVRLVYANNLKSMLILNAYMAT